MTATNQNVGLLFRMGVGEFGLAITFWIYGVLAQAIFSIIAILLIWLFDYENARIFLNCLYMLSTTYMVIFLFGLWDASNNYNGNKKWSVLSKIYVILTVISIPVSIAKWIF
ncbi:MAG: hypothetical protein GY799_19090 [Desulfobulbaceae bacterium]|nr:hypothetical protein [Desulfobulbaceae bacterium]